MDLILAKVELELPTEEKHAPRMTPPRLHQTDRRSKTLVNPAFEAPPDQSELQSCAVTRVEQYSDCSVLELDSRQLVCVCKELGAGLRAGDQVQFYNKVPLTQQGQREYCFVEKQHIQVVRL